MKKEWKIGIGLVALVVGLACASAQAAYISQGWNFNGVQVSLSAEQSAEKVRLSADAATELLIETASANIAPNYWDPSEFVWGFHVSGRRDLPAVSQSMSLHSQCYGGGIDFWQSVFIGSYDDNGVEWNFGGSNMEIGPASFQTADAWYNEWETGGVGKGEEVPSIEKWWGVNVMGYGSFGEGEAGDEIGRAFFNLPEPASLAMLGVGIPLFLRRRRR